MIKSVEEFLQLRTSDLPEEYRKAVSDEISDTVLLEVIQKHPDMIVWIVRNKTVPIRILRVLAEHPDPAVRTEVAMKRKLDEKLFDKLSSDDNETVRHRIACNKKVPLAVLRRLTLDTCEFVSQAAIKRLKEYRKQSDNC